MLKAQFLNRHRIQSTQKQTSNSNWQQIIKIFWIYKIFEKLNQQRCIKWVFKSIRLGEVKRITKSWNCLHIPFFFFLIWRTWFKKNLHAISSWGLLLFPMNFNLTIFSHYSLKTWLLMSSYYSITKNRSVFVFPDLVFSYFLKIMTYITKCWLHI